MMMKMMRLLAQSEWPSNNSMQRTGLRAAADAERSQARLYCYRTYVTFLGNPHPQPLSQSGRGETKPIQGSALRP